MLPRVEAVRRSFAAAAALLLVGCTDFRKLREEYCVNFPNARACKTPIGGVPAPPVLTTSPKSPANENGPLVTATAETGASVRLFAGQGCAGELLFDGVAESGSASFKASVPDNSTTIFSAKAVRGTAGVPACPADPVRPARRAARRPPPPPGRDAPSGRLRRRDPSVSRQRDPEGSAT